MKRKFIFILELVLLIMIPVFGYSQHEEALVENMGNGRINWSKGIVTAKGIGAPPEKYYGKPQAQPAALTAAKHSAVKNLLEIVNSVRIDSTTTIKDFAVASNAIYSKINGMVRDAQIIKQKYMSDGTVEVTVQMSLWGGFSQLVLPRDIQQVESIKPMKPAKTESLLFTGLVVNARGLNIRPAMSPKILDESGQQVYGSAYVSREYAVQQGMSGYAKDLSMAMKDPRVADNPLVVKGIRTKGAGNSDIVISNADASRLKSASENLSFLKKCRVLIVVD